MLGRISALDSAPEPRETGMLDVWPTTSPRPVAINTPAGARLPLTRKDATMHDVQVLTRCPKCAAPCEEFIHHERSTKAAPTLRRECVACPFVEYAEGVETS